MNTKIIEVAKHSGIYGISSALQSVIGFALLPLLTKFYSAEEFGVYSLLILVSTLAGAFFYFGSTSTLNRYFFEVDTVEHKKLIVSTTFLIILVGASLQVLLGFIFATKISILLTNSSAYEGHVFLIMLANAFSMLMNYNFMVLRLEKKSKVFVILNVGMNLINVFLVYVLLVHFNSGIYAPIVGLLMANVIAFVISLIFIRNFFVANIDSGMLGEYLYFGISASLNGLTYYFLDWIDRFFLKEYASLSDVGIYSIGYKMGLIIHIIMIIPFSMIWSTVRFQYAKDPDNSEFVTRIISYYTVIGLFLLLVTSLFAKELLFIFSGREEYYIAYKIMPIIMIAHLLYGYINIVDFGILISKKLYFFYITFIVAAGLNALLNFIFIPKFGYMASAYITLVTYFFCTAVIYIIGNRFYYLQIDWKRVLSPFLFVIVLLFLADGLIFSFLTNILIKLISITISGLIIYKFWLTESERKIARGLPSYFKSLIVK
jgi:O-antigen/teichoic acid export membrane protein